MNHRSPHSPTDPNEARVESTLQAKGLNAPRITPNDLDAEIIDAQFYVFPGTTVTVCLLLLTNGFTVTGESACASPENFDEQVGRDIARRNARDKLWSLLGFRLRDKLHALAKGVSQVEAPPAPAKIIGKSGLVLLAAARAAHEVNRAYCESMGDRSQPVWDAAPAWQRDSAIEGVKSLLANPHLTPADLHDGWLRHKAADGWVYGPVKDPDKKTHPCMVAFDDLPPAQRAKDLLFRAAALNAAVAAGWHAPNLADTIERVDADAPLPEEPVAPVPASAVTAIERPSNAAAFEQERRRRAVEPAPNDARPDINAMVGSTHIDNTPKQEG